jgi:hypothetical protein
MLRRSLFASGIGVAILAAGNLGCQDGSVPVTEDSSLANSSLTSSAHDHPDHGPHGGDLIELGDDGYHAELVERDGDEIWVHLLGSDAKTAVPIDAEKLRINLVDHGNPRQFELAALPAEGDPAGQSSRFRSADPELWRLLHREHATARLAVVIDGKQYLGTLEHERGHAHHHDHH